MPKIPEKDTSKMAGSPEELDGRNGDSERVRTKTSSNPKLASPQQGFDNKKLSADRLKPAVDEDGEEIRLVRPTDLKLEIAETPSGGSKSGPMSPLDALEAVRAVMPKMEEARRVSDARYGKKGAIREMDDDEPVPVKSVGSVGDGDSDAAKVKDSKEEILVARNVGSKAAEQSQGELNSPPQVSGKDHSDAEESDASKKLSSTPGGEEPASDAVAKSKRKKTPPKEPLPEEEPAVAAKKNESGKKEGKTPDGDSAEVLSPASLGGLDILLEDSSDPSPPGKDSSKKSRISLAGLSDYLAILQAMKAGNVAWMIGLAVPSLALILFMTVPAFLFYTPEHKSYYYFSKGIDNEPLRWVSIGLATICTIIAFVYPLLLKKSGLVELDSDDETD